MFTIRNLDGKINSSTSPKYALLNRTFSELNAEVRVYEGVIASEKNRLNGVFQNDLKSGDIDQLKSSYTQYLDRIGELEAKHLRALNITAQQLKNELLAFNKSQYGEENSAIPETWLGTMTPKAPIHELWK